MPKCAACGKFIAAVDGVKCSKCCCVFHRPCIKIPCEATVKPDWLCPECKLKLPRNNRTGTPVKGLGDDYVLANINQGGLGTKPTVEHSRDVEVELLAKQSVESPAQHSVIFPVDSAAENITASAHMTKEPELIREFRLFRDEMQAMRTEMQDFRSEFRNELRAVKTEVQDVRREVATLTTSYKACFERVDALDIKVHDIETKLAQRNDTSSLELLVAKLQADIDERDQRILQNDVEISGIPEQEGESTMHIVTAVATKLGVSLGDHEVVYASRVGSRQDINIEGISRPRPIVVSLVRRVLRDNLIKNARVRRGVTTDQLGLLVHDPVRFYINERLTKTNRVLFGKARQQAKRYQWSYLWIKEGRIYAKRDKASTTHLIRHEKDLDRVFGLDSTLYTK